MQAILKNLIGILFLLGIFSQVNADESYTFQDTVLKSSNGKTAKVFLGVPLEIKKDKGSSSEVVIKGYQFDDKPNNIYSSKGKELLIVVLDEGFKVSKKSGNKVELAGIIENEIITKDGKEIWEEHEEFYYDMCSVCHAAPQVPHHTMLEWEALFIPMQGFAKIDDDEAAYLLRYIKSNASNGLLKADH